MGAFIEGWDVLLAHSRDFLVVMAWILGGGVLVISFLGGNRALPSGLADRISLVTSCWVLPGSVLAVSGLLAQRWLGVERAGLWLFVAAALIGVGAAWRFARQPARLPRQDVSIAGLLVAATFALVLLRLVFLRDLLLPQYFDSASHYGLIRAYLEWAERAAPTGPIVLPMAPYYHVGYHLLMAGIASVTHLDIGTLMLVSGQLILALTPLSLYALAHRLTGSAMAAVIAVALAAAGWYVPAFAANWGKYPALLGVLPTLGALTVGLLALDSPSDARARRSLWIVSVLLATTAGLVHTRSMAIIVAFVAAGAVALQLWRLPARGKQVSAGLSLLVLMGLVWSVWRVPELRPALEPYYGAGMLPTLLVGVLGIFAFTHRPQIALAICLFVAFMLAGLLVPSPWPAFGSLLDRPFAELWIFVPLSLLGAVGFAGLARYVSPVGGKVVAALLASALVGHALVAYDLNASSCCTIVAREDLVALDWLGTNLGTKDMVAIAMEPLQVGPVGDQRLAAPVDAGAWINPITGLGVVLVSSDVDLRAQAAHDDLCGRGARYIYLGGSSRSFDAVPLRGQPALFTARLQLPGASIFEILGCRE